MERSESTVLVDLHCHSDASDGYYGPDIVAERLARAGVAYAALTDHQTTRGTATFHDTATGFGVADIAGAEVSASLEGIEVHLLAYGFDPESPVIQALFSRPVSARETIAAIHEAGGLAVLAHPFHTTPITPDIDGLVERLVERGLDGIEAFYAPYSAQQRRQLLDLADRHGLLTTGGSDYHGNGHAGARNPGVAVPHQRWKQFREALRQPAQPVQSGGRKEKQELSGIDWRRLAVRIMLPSLLVIAFFVTLLFAGLIPTVEELLLERKRETTAELTNSAWSILADYNRAVDEGRMTLDEAQNAAIERIRRLRYGPESLDYFWITDMHPRMVMHPYRADLEGTDLTTFTDPEGVRPFVEFVQAVRDRSSGYVTYVWQWQDDPERLEAKESYVRGFEPWEWIIGTGLYVDDVNREIAAITGRMIDASFVVTILATALLVIITYQSLKLERRRSEAERELHLSHERYQLLVESSTAGTLLLVDGRCTYANRPLLEMLQYSVSELALLDLHDIVAPAEHTRETGDAEAESLRRVAAGEEVREPFEILITPKNGPPMPALLSSTPVFFAGRGGTILNVQDIGHQKAMRTALGESRAKYEVLAQNISSGVFRLLPEGDAPIIEMNPAARRIFGIAEDSEPSVSFRDLLVHGDMCDLFLERIHSDGTVRDLIVQLRGQDGKVTTARLSAVRSESSGDMAFVVDAIMDDISDRRRADAQQETLISQLQTSLLFLTEPVRNSMNEPISCSLETPVAAVVRMMGRHDTEAIVVVGPDRTPIGIVTDHDIRQRIVAEEQDTRIPVSRIMSAPVITIDESAPVFEAFLRERSYDIDHLVVTDTAGTLAGIVRSSRTVRLDDYSPVVLLRQIESAASVEDLTDCHDKLPVLVGSLVESGAAAENICHVTTAISDAITERTIVLAMEELGPAPCPFAFIALGSEAREEQTLATDQDNAIIYADDDEIDAEGTPAAAEYFLSLGTRVCRDLDRVGYPFCEGEAMAQDPRWNKPVSQWLSYFQDWIKEPDGTALAHCNVFFDLRCVYGDRSLAREVRRHVDTLLDRYPAFFAHMALNTLHYKPPIGLFGQIVTGSSSGSPNTFNIKEAMLPIVNFARLLALKHHLSETSTFDRLEQLHALGVLHDESFRGTVQAYDQLMRLRYRHQVSLLKEGKPADNSIDPRTLTRIDSGMVKNTLSRISTIQKKVSLEFRGST
ncbi:MAG: PAS domain-containing protein [Spirochaetaceae bacterium]|nr:MAG: PAS domain-containing protein [Spirochaetaceae bacterium]